MYRGSSMEIYNIICKIDSQWEFAVWFKELKHGLCDNLEAWDGEGDGREEPRVYLWLTFDAWQKATKSCKANILQLKKLSGKKNSSKISLFQKYPYFKNMDKYLLQIKQNWENSLLTDLNWTTRNVKRSSSAKKKKKKFKKWQKKNWGL